MPPYTVFKIEYISYLRPSCLTGLWFIALNISIRRKNMENWDFTNRWNFRRQPTVSIIIFSYRIQGGSLCIHDHNQRIWFYERKTSLKFIPGGFKYRGQCRIQSQRQALFEKSLGNMSGEFDGSRQRPKKTKWKLRNFELTAQVIWTN